MTRSRPVTASTGSWTGAGPLHRRLARSTRRTNLPVDAQRSGRVTSRPFREGARAVGLVGAVEIVEPSDEAAGRFGVGGCEVAGAFDDRGGDVVAGGGRGGDVEPFVAGRVMAEDAGFGPDRAVPRQPQDVVGVVERLG